MPRQKTKEMDYQEVIRYLVDEVPMFQKVGGSAYKEGLDNTYALDEHFGHPHQSYKTIHVAGTNGKGSCSHTLAAILQMAGYRVGLYTSPHLVDFRERIKVNGRMIDKDYVTDFVSSNIKLFKTLTPSFFELTTALAFSYFKDMSVDVAVIEVGMGGRLDCTNIITPDLAIITNISLDHVQFLGNTLGKIAAEKAGIIKKGVPVVIGEANEHTRPVFEAKAKETDTEIVFAEDVPMVTSAERASGGYTYHCQDYGEIFEGLAGDYQVKNTNTVLWALRMLRDNGYDLPSTAVKDGFKDVCSITGFYGRWQTLRQDPLVVCDAGHNVGGIAWVTEQLSSVKHDKLYFVIGMVGDKDIDGVLGLLPKDAYYIFTKASIKRALDEHQLHQMAAAKGLHGETARDVPSAYERALSLAKSGDMVFIGGSCFVVADLLSHINNMGH